MFTEEAAGNTIQTVLSPAESGRTNGLRDGYAEGYLRGRASYIVNQPRPAFPVRKVKVLYVSSGKGFPYSPLDDAVTTTLRTLTAEMIAAVPGDPIPDLVAQHKPDLLLALDGLELPVEHLSAVRAMGVPTAVWFTDDPYYTDLTIPLSSHYDYVFTLERNCVDTYRAAGCSQVHYLPFAAFPGHYRPTLIPSPHRRNLSFIGSAYWNRVIYLQPVLPALMEQGLLINGIWWDRLPEFPAYADRIELGKWMGPVETSEVYSGSKIVLNLHRSPFEEDVNNNQAGIPAASPNPRTFEISACATLQLVDARDDLASFYLPGEEIETFTSPEELVDKVRYYLTHEEERREIALRALDRTLRDHTYANRLDQLLSVIFG
ncbi:glycosyltransferase [Paenibacillus timonensis]|jgi:spore maturation protein CgeB|uniref:Glycosyltransferase n=2 Tax=Paenibacillus TaxID=44249 RepID=A0ABW3SJH6_9BACL|nr:glycosyltransferase [Paenibacillus timonensis]MCH1642995.1 glycosyltransferase [Paenibacillus timonensis]GJM79139.1 spore maturation protein [Paenibacillus sp. HMSSN-139]